MSYASSNNKLVSSVYRAYILMMTYSLDYFFLNSPFALSANYDTIIFINLIKSHLYNFKTNLN